MEKESQAFHSQLSVANGWTTRCRDSILFHFLISWFDTKQTWWQRVSYYLNLVRSRRETHHIVYGGRADDRNTYMYATCGTPPADQISIICTRMKCTQKVKIFAGKSSRAWFEKRTVREWDEEQIGKQLGRGADVWSLKAAHGISLSWWDFW